MSITTQSIENQVLLLKLLKQTDKRTVNSLIQELECSIIEHLLNPDLPEQETENKQPTQAPTQLTQEHLQEPVPNIKEEAKDSEDSVEDSGEVKITPSNVERAQEQASKFEEGDLPDHIMNQIKERGMKSRTENYKEVYTDESIYLWIFLGSKLKYLPGKQPTPKPMIVELTNTAATDEMVPVDYDYQPSTEPDSVPELGLGGQ